MATFKWIKEKLPIDLEVKQVYGVIFSNDGKILLRIENNKYKLTGGKPERNETFEETLKREYMEELNIEIDNIHYLGYLLVKEDNDNNPYAQVRMIATIKKINENRPDTDTGILYERFLANLDNVKKYLNYKDDAGNTMIDDAITLANQKYKFKKDSKEYYV